MTARALSLALMLVIVGCSIQQFPFIGETASQFTSQRRSFDELAANVRADQLFRVSLTSFVDSSVRVEAHAEDWPGHTPPEPRASEYESLLKATGTVSATQINGDVFVSLGERFIEETLWSVAYLSTPRTDAFGPNCPANVPTPCGRCVVPLKDDWYVGYFWRPAELKQAKDICYMPNNFFGKPSNQPLHPTPTAAEAPASGAGERRR